MNHYIITKNGIFIVWSDNTDEKTYTSISKDQLENGIYDIESVFMDIIPYSDVLLHTTSIIKAKTFISILQRGL
jgi:hypothetical protein